ncbi:hypothetical protein ACFSAV_11510 [Pasteurella oralis]|uniref:Lipoprotein n=2 Tax=Pasteurella oralis TaxID=1071947 RepID=A0ABW4NZG8_9PAST
MKQINLLLFSVIALNLASCAQPSVSAHPQIEAHKPFSVTQTEKRINTMACQDKDDWYLDGYRVGKSFRQHKQKMLAQRSTYCEQQTQQAIAQVFLISWENGYQQGLKR